MSREVVRHSDGTVEEYESDGVAIVRYARWPLVVSTIAALGFGAFAYIDTVQRERRRPEMAGVEVVAGSENADPTQLPAADSVTAQPSGDYGSGVAATNSYVDPVTGVTVIKMSDSITTDSTHAWIDYWGGGLMISHPWSDPGDDCGDATDVCYTLFWHVDAFGPLLTVYNYTDNTFPRTTLAVSPINGTNLSFAFSNDPSTPRIAYTLDGSELNRYDTDEDVNAEANAGTNFPHSPATAFGGSGVWLTNDTNDDRFCWQDLVDTGPGLCWDESSDTEIFTYNQSTDNINEASISLTGTYAMAAENVAGEFTAVAYDLSTGNPKDTLESGPKYTHGQPGLEDYVFAVDGDNYALYYAALVDGSPPAFDTIYIGSPFEYYHALPPSVTATGTGVTWRMAGSGQGTGAAQWHIVIPYSVSITNAGGKCQRYVCWIRGDTEEVRLVLYPDHISSGGDPTVAPYGQMSPDGKLFLFHSNSEDASGLTNVYLAIMPTA